MEHIGPIVDKEMIAILTKSMESMNKIILEHNEQLKAIWLAIDRLEKGRNE